MDKQELLNAIAECGDKLDKLRNTPRYILMNYEAWLFLNPWISKRKKWLKRIRK